MLTRSRRLMLFLVVMSVVGILSMHEFDPVVATADQHHGSQASGPETGGNAHAAIGFCVFVAAVAALGLATIRRLQGTKSLAGVVNPPGRVYRTRPMQTAGPRLPYRLCVLRL